MQYATLFLSLNLNLSVDEPNQEHMVIANSLNTLHDMTNLFSVHDFYSVFTLYKRDTALYHRVHTDLPSGLLLVKDLVPIVIPFSFLFFPSCFVGHQLQHGTSRYILFSFILFTCVE